MTREEAVNELSVLHERFNNGMGWRDGNYTEALEMAIDAITSTVYEIIDKHFPRGGNAE